MVLYKTGLAKENKMGEFEQIVLEKLESEYQHKSFVIAHPEDA